MCKITICTCRIYYFRNNVLIQRFSNLQTVQYTKNILYRSRNLLISLLGSNRPHRQRNVEHELGQLRVEFVSNFIVKLNLFIKAKIKRKLR